MFVKMNWSSPSDSEWVCPDLQCATSNEVFNLLKSSEKINQDLLSPFQYEEVEGWKPDEYYIVCQKWHKLNKSMEFRCFVKDHTLLAIS